MLMRTLYLSCGALAREFIALSRFYGWEDSVTIDCLPASWHNHPEKIVPALEKKIKAAKIKGIYDRIYILYGDCGTGGQLDDMLKREEVERIEGAHCYEFFATPSTFREICEKEPGTFFLTDYLTRHFDRLIIKGLGLDRHPELRDDYFGHYRKLVYLAQTEQVGLKDKAAKAAKQLGLEFEYRYDEYGDMANFLKEKQAWHN